MQWAAAEDMRTNCFVCGREAFVFEHAGAVSLHYI